MRDSRSTLLVLAACAVLWGGIVLHNAIKTLGSEIHEPSVPQSDVRQFARAKLSELQQQSFDSDVELCGIIAENSEGELISRTLTEGEQDSCDIAYFDVRTLLPRATFHTHAGYSAQFDSEVPSVIDMQGDMSSRLNGYIATPGGRFWEIDWQRGVAKQICGEGCLPQDSNYRQCNAPPPESEYTLERLQARERMAWPGC